MAGGGAKISEKPKLGESPGCQASEHFRELKKNIYMENIQTKVCCSPPGPPKKYAPKKYVIPVASGGGRRGGGQVKHHKFRNCRFSRVLLVENDQLTLT